MVQLSFQIQSVLNWLFESTLYVSILICLIFIIRIFTKRKLPLWWSYCLWLLLLLRMLVPWSIDTPMSVFSYLPAPPMHESYLPHMMTSKVNSPFIQDDPETTTAIPSPPYTDLSNPAERDYDNNDQSNDTTTSDYSVSFDKIVLTLWFAGVLFFVIITIIKNIKFWQLIRMEAPITDMGVLDSFDECRSMLGVRKKVDIIVTGSVKSPAIFGYINPQLLLPLHFFDALEKEELNCVFLHELGHMKRHDIAVSWLVTFFQIIYWYNPLVWCAFHHLRADQEIACDAYVLSKIKQVRPTDYAGTIVKLLERFVQNRQLPSLAGIIENKTQIDRRISMILDFKRVARKKTFVSILMLFLITGVFIACSTGRFSDREPSSSGTARLEETRMKTFRSDWYYSPDLPKNGITSPYQPADLAHAYTITLESKTDGNILIDMSPSNSEQSLHEMRDFVQKMLPYTGAENFSIKEATIKAGKVLMLEINIGNLSFRNYFIKEGNYIYSVKFVASKTEGIPADRVEEYEQAMKAINMFKANPDVAGMKEYGGPDLENPIASGMKRYISPEGDFTVDIPGDWHPYVNFSGHGKSYLFGTPNNDLAAIFLPRAHSPARTPEGRRYGQITSYTDAEWKILGKSETVINEREDLILDSNRDAVNIRNYFVREGDYFYSVYFYTFNTEGITADRIEDIERVMRSMNIIHKNP